MRVLVDLSTVVPSHALGNTHNNMHAKVMNVERAGKLVAPIAKFYIPYTMAAFTSHKVYLVISHPIKKS